MGTCAVRIGLCPRSETATGTEKKISSHNMKYKYHTYIFIFILYFNLTIFNVCTVDTCGIKKKNGECITKYESYNSHFTRKRYLFYDINPAEGFNLRRDVYIRVATFVKKLTENDALYQWNLVLPPWGNLFHWQSFDIGDQNLIPWGKFFDLDSLRKYVPVIEMYEFFQENSKENDEIIIDQVYILKNDEEMFKTGNFEDKNIITDCPKTTVSYKKNSNGRFTGAFWGYQNITTSSIKCITFHGTTFDLKQNLHPNLYRTIMFDRMEIPLHHTYGSSEYWQARRSMCYNSELYDFANKFRLIYLNSNDIDDNTRKSEDWRMKLDKRSAIGGPYLAVHFRRKDFLIGRSTSLPSVEEAALQITKTLKLLNLNVVFIATDAENEEYSNLRNILYNYSVFRFTPTKSIKKIFKDGGIAIIDQIICSHARFFIGTQESTFTYRIQEDREILGFPANTTFNRRFIWYVANQNEDNFYKFFFPFDTRDIIYLGLMKS